MNRKDNIVVQEMDGEVLIYDLTENKAYCLNETSAIIWQACDGNKSVAEISEYVSEKLSSPANEDLIWFAIDQLKKERLIENGETLPNHFLGMSRREVIKKVGLGSMIALPIVAAMTAPQAIHANSVCGNTCVCDNTNWMTGDVCTTSVACPANTPPCMICIAGMNGMSVAGSCYFG